MEGLLYLNILQQLEDELDRDENNMQRRILRDNSNPFQMPDDVFVKYYRFNKNSTRNLIEIIRPHLPQAQICTAVPVELKVLTLLYFLGHGSYQKCIGMNFSLCLEQSTVSNIIEETTNVLSGFLQNYVNFPRTVHEKNIIKQGFFEKYQFPGIIGAIDCTHIAIVAPPSEDAIRPGLMYYNRKGFYSINVQMICDSNLTITNCNARFPGSTHDSAIWSLSPVRNYLYEEFSNGRNNNDWLLGDAGYPLEPWLLVPQDYVDINTPEGRYTQSHIRTRSTIERCFGVLKQRFRCLLKDRTLHYDPVKAAKIVYCCAILHNIAIEQNIPLPHEEYAPGNVEVPDVVAEPVNDGMIQAGNALRQEGLRRINVLKNTNFVN